MIVISGFEPFAGLPYNPTRDVIEELNRKYGQHISTVILPVEFDRAAQILFGYIHKQKPHIVVSLGLASVDKGHEKEVMNLEGCAKNIMDAPRPDARGYQPREIVIEPRRHTTLEMSSQTQRLVSRLQQRRIASRTSEDAGEYVCNDLMYRVMSDIHAHGMNTLFHFLHIPWLTHYRDERYREGFRGLCESGFDIKKKAAVSLEDVREGIEVIVASVL